MANNYRACHLLISKAGAKQQEGVVTENLHPLMDVLLTICPLPNCMTAWSFALLPVPPANPSDKLGAEVKHHPKCLQQEEHIALLQRGKAKIIHGRTFGEECRSILEAEESQKKQVYQKHLLMKLKLNHRD